MSMADIRRGDIWWVSLDPTQGSEIKKTRPCVVITHNTLNKLRKTVVVVPLSTAVTAHPPVTVSVTCEKRAAVAVIDQIRAVTRHRFKTRIETLLEQEFAGIIKAVSAILEIH
jgi:mRNA interferase MazF